MSLRNRLLFSIFVTLLLSLIAAAAFTYWHAVKKIDTEMNAAIAVGGRVAHNAVNDTEEAADPHDVLELSEQRSLDSGLIRELPLRLARQRAEQPRHDVLPSHPLLRLGK